MNTNSERQREREREGRDLMAATKSKSKHYFGLTEIGKGLKGREDFRHGLDKGRGRGRGRGSWTANAKHKAQITDYNFAWTPH